MLERRILVTGGSGLLGSTLRGLGWKRADFPTHDELDVTDGGALLAFLEGGAYATVLHAAAATSPPLVEREPGRALSVNILGTCNVVSGCMRTGARLVYVSTDYVFRGDRGGYKPEDEVFPVNKYAWSKLGGECAVRLHDSSLIIRTSFGPDLFPYPRAFVDQTTSREPVSVIAEKIKELAESLLTGTVHIGAKARTVYEYARALGAVVQPISINDVGFPVPKDTSLDLTTYEEWKHSSEDES